MSGPHVAHTRSAVISFASSGDNTVVSAPASGAIRIYAITFTVSAATQLKYKDSVVGDLSGAFRLTGDGSSMTLPLKSEPWYNLQPGSNFLMNSTNAVSFGGTVWYTIG